ncbi:MAG TPA: hypothetical protein VEF76_01090 [Patescibacteria group bacterium]|nr:hypothetical protein [Patescibacteria group bacterium]
MPIWPETLPQSPLSEGFREMPPDVLARSEMDTGPAKLRPRTSAGCAKLEVTYILSREEVEMLSDFYNEELMWGALAFSFPHPRLEEPADCRFRQPPSYTAINGDFFKVACQLEVLP